jgi:predicted PurR-regulated permease PerM
MIKKLQTLPLTVRRSIEVIGFLALFTIIYLGSDIIMPLILALLFSVLLLPVYRFFKRRRFPNILATLTSLFTLLAVFALIVWFLSDQLITLFSDFPTIKANILVHLNNLSAWIDRKMHFSGTEQLAFVNAQSEKVLTMAGVAVRNAANSLTGFLLYATLVPLYIFLILQYKNLLLRFLFLWFNSDQQDNVRLAVRDTETIIKSYLGGLLIQITYMIILVGGSLWVIGIEHALLIGIIFAFLNLIPYIGALFGIIIGILLTLASTQDIEPIFVVVGVIAAAQFLDNNILMPRIVGSKVQINALASIFGVIIGGALAGIIGMFLSLPIMAILKVIFQRTESMYHWSVLLGDDVPGVSPMMEVLPVAEEASPDEVKPVD